MTTSWILFFLVIFGTSESLVHNWVNRVLPSSKCDFDRCWTKTPAVEPWWDYTSEQREMQTSDFCEGLWGLSTVPAPDIPEADEGDDHVRITIYNIGGSMTKILGASVNKEFPLIPHVGVRVRGREYFFSDHIEDRASIVMNEMMPRDLYPQICLDLGITERDEASISKWLDEIEGTFNPDNYDLWTLNCNHFARDFAEFLLPGCGMPEPLMTPILDFTDSMLDAVPEWRRAAGHVFMKQVSRLVVVSWGRVTRKEKEIRAGKLGVANERKESQQQTAIIG